MIDSDVFITDTFYYTLVCSFCVFGVFYKSIYTTLTGIHVCNSVIQTNWTDANNKQILIPDDLILAPTPNALS